MATREKKCPRNVRKCAELNRIILKQELKARANQVGRILKKPENARSAEEALVLSQSPDMVEASMKRAQSRERARQRKEEQEDPMDLLRQKCQQLADAIRSARSVVVYTGAGISTAASIPDYRGPNGVWTLLEKGIEPEVFMDLSDAEPTYTHMAISMLYHEGYVKYVVSQNCDGLHVRSGLPQHCLSELHGNMYLELCTSCRPQHEFLRLFDVTERTGVRRHKTGRKCPHCGSDLRDTIVHFGEKGSFNSPYNWEEAAGAADKADLIICLGSSLKVLKRYACLWATHKPAIKRPALYIANLQWTPRDDAATLKLNGKCDDVMRMVMEHLELEPKQYQREYDPLFHLAIPLNPSQVHTTTKKVLVPPDKILWEPNELYFNHKRKRKRKLKTDLDFKKKFKARHPDLVSAHICYVAKQRLKRAEHLSFEKWKFKNKVESSPVKSERPFSGRKTKQEPLKEEREIKQEEPAMLTFDAYSNLTPVTTLSVSPRAKVRPAVSSVPTVNSGTGPGVSGSPLRSPGPTCVSNPGLGPVKIESVAMNVVIKTEPDSDPIPPSTLDSSHAPCQYDTVRRLLNHITSGRSTPGNSFPSARPTHNFSVNLGTANHRSDNVPTTSHTLSGSSSCTQTVSSLSTSAPGLPPISSLCSSLATSPFEGNLPDMDKNMYQMLLESLGMAQASPPPAPPPPPSPPPPPPPQPQPPNQNMQSASLLSHAQCSESSSVIAPQYVVSGSPETVPARTDKFPSILQALSCASTSLTRTPSVTDHAYTRLPAGSATDSEPKLWVGPGSYVSAPNLTPAEDFSQLENTVAVSQPTSMGTNPISIVSYPMMASYHKPASAVPVSESKHMTTVPSLIPTSTHRIASSQPSSMVKQVTQNLDLDLAAVTPANAQRYEGAPQGYVQVYRQSAAPPSTAAASLRHTPTSALRKQPAPTSTGPQPTSSPAAAPGQVPELIQQTLPSASSVSVTQVGRMLKPALLVPPVPAAHALVIQPNTSLWPFTSAIPFPIQLALAQIMRIQPGPPPQQQAFPGTMPVQAPTPQPTILKTPQPATPAVPTVSRVSLADSANVMLHRSNPVAEQKLSRSPLVSPTAARMPMVTPNVRVVHPEELAALQLSVSSAAGSSGVMAPPRMTTPLFQQRLPLNPQSSVATSHSVKIVTVHPKDFANLPISRAALSPSAAMKLSHPGTSVAPLLSPQPPACHLSSSPVAQYPVPAARTPPAQVVPFGSVSLQGLAPNVRPSHQTGPRSTPTSLSSMTSTSLLDMPISPGQTLPGIHTLQRQARSNTARSIPAACIAQSSSFSMSSLSGLSTSVTPSLAPRLGQSISQLQRRALSGSGITSPSVQPLTVSQAVTSHLATSHGKPSLSAPLVHHVPVSGAPSARAPVSAAYSQLCQSIVESRLLPSVASVLQPPQSPRSVTHTVSAPAVTSPHVTPPSDPVLPPHIYSTLSKLEAGLPSVSQADLAGFLPPKRGTDSTVVSQSIPSLDVAPMSSVAAGQTSDVCGPGLGAASPSPPLHHPPNIHGFPAADYSVQPPAQLSTCSLSGISTATVNARKPGGFAFPLPPARSPRVNRVVKTSPAVSMLTQHRLLTASAGQAAMPPPASPPPSPANRTNPKSLPSSTRGSVINAGTHVMHPSAPSSAALSGCSTSSNGTTRAVSWDRHQSAGTGKAEPTCMPSTTDSVLSASKQRVNTTQNNKHIFASGSKVFQPKALLNNKLSNTESTCFSNELKEDMAMVMNDVDFSSKPSFDANDCSVDEVPVLVTQTSVADGGSISATTVVTTPATKPPDTGSAVTTTSCPVTSAAPSLAASRPQRRRRAPAPPDADVTFSSRAKVSRSESPNHGRNTPSKPAKVAMRNGNKKPLALKIPEPPNTDVDLQKSCLNLMANDATVASLAGAEAEGSVDSTPEDGKPALDAVSNTKSPVSTSPGWFGKGLSLRKHKKKRVK